MPNHCSNAVYLPVGDTATEVLKPYISTDKDGESILDFNKIIPMPEALDGESTQYSNDVEEQKRIEQQNLEKFGHKNWYDWRVANWDTKWNSYWVHFDDNCVRFSTAWSPPMNVIKKLAELLKKPLRLTYVDEAYIFWGEALIDEEGQDDDYCYESLKDTPPELAEELGVAEAFEEDKEDEAEDEKELRSEAEQILMQDENYKNLMKGVKK